MPLLIAILLLSTVSEGLRSMPITDRRGSLKLEQEHQVASKGTSTEQLKEVHATGSSVPDCSHACGSCSPCNRVMVSFKCSIPEPCPMVYRCMCRGNLFPVPSS
ncbi:Protein EPIDERMAL PATTERNING FACTOR 2 [Carex littledalei]|uniref:Epidermal patterning factor-like protein n=1 Tax=Carex littledalei TaxID=544730 RepID=A0A833V512_9POAL|nr:Protein EPIDERMAL PATTERNING FACTOR 2 [Carex littledalei]